MSETDRLFNELVAEASRLVAEAARPAINDGWRETAVHGVSHALDRYILSVAQAAVGGNQEMYASSAGRSLAVLAVGRVLERHLTSGAETEVARLRRALANIADTCVQDPDTAQFAARVLDGSAEVEP